MFGRDFFLRLWRKVVPIATLDTVLAGFQQTIDQLSLIAEQQQAAADASHVEASRLASLSHQQQADAHRAIQVGINLTKLINGD